MISELRSRDYDITRNARFPEVRAVAQGINPGVVYGDDPVDPSAALVWAEGIRGFYLVGESSSPLFRRELNQFTDAVLIPKLRASGFDYLEISGEEGWNQVIEKIYEKRNLEVTTQRVYAPAYGAVRAQAPASPSGCRLVRLDPESTEELTPETRARVESKIKEYWDSLESFFTFGIGYALLCGSDLASLCMSGFVAGTVHVIDIETQEQFQRHGYGYAVGSAFVSECMRKGHVPYWDCMETNRASVALAEKLGLLLQRSYTLYEFAVSKNSST